MHVLVACEFSGVVREAFRVRGHDAWSCDLLPSHDCSEFHLQGDVRDFLKADFPHGWTQWDLMIAHPPCTYLCSSGLHWNARTPGRDAKTDEAVEFVKELAAVPIPRVAIENPIGVLSSRIRKPDQIIQPWQFGHGEVKATCLWLRGLPNLRATNVMEGRKPRVHHEPPGPDRWKRRSVTYAGIAAAMAEQWGAA